MASNAAPMRQRAERPRTGVDLVPLALLTCLLGCHEAPTAPVAARTVTIPPPATEYLVREAQLAGGGIAVKLEVPLTPQGPKPALIALIGNVRPLLSAGFVVVTYSIDWNALKRPTPEPLNSETAVGTWVLQSPSAGVLGERYLREIATIATQLVPQVIDWVARDRDVDPARIGMAGGSTNGFITLQAAAADARLRAVVAIAACADYHGFLRDSSMGLRGQPLALDDAYEQWVREQELIRRPDRLVHTAVLMVNRSGDELIPIACADATADVLRRAYAEAGVPDRFRYVRFENAGHGIGTDEYLEALSWFEQWLQPAPARP